MKRVNFRSVVDRFHHVDGEIVSVDLSFSSNGGPAKAQVVLRFYPWWEHPLYIAARDAGRPWGFTDTEAAARDILIEAVKPLRCDVRQGTSAIDVGFFLEHPVLWEFEQEAQIFCNSDFDPSSLVAALLDAQIPYVDEGTLLRYLPPIRNRKAPYSLGHFPTTLFRHVEACLRDLGVRLFIPHAPDPPEDLVALSVDDNVMIVAEDFELVVPDFEHRAEWFRPESTA